MRRCADIFFASTGLFFLSPVFAAAAVAIKLADTGPVFFTQDRMGKGFRPFRLYKFRTMAVDGEQELEAPAGAVWKPLVTAADDRRITDVGRFLRRTKLDELPQLFNVLKGDMSLVGPRPEVHEYACLFEEEYREILDRTKPGLTDLVTLDFINEEELLKGSPNPEKSYVENILPAKLDLYKKYGQRAGFRSEAAVILKTISRSFRGFQA